MLGSRVASDDLAVNGVEMMNTFFLMHAFPYTLYVDYMVCTHILYSQWIARVIFLIRPQSVRGGRQSLLRHPHELIVLLSVPEDASVDEVLHLRGVLLQQATTRLLDHLASVLLLPRLLLEASQLSDSLFHLSSARRLNDVVS